MFDLNFIAEPGIQAETTEASWSFLQEKTENKIEDVPKSQIMKSSNSGTNWKYYGIAAYAIIILVLIGIFGNYQPKMDSSMVLNQVIDLIIESGYMKDLQLMEAHFKPDFVKVTIIASDLAFLQNFVQGYHTTDKIPYEIFQKNKLNYVSLNFPWDAENNREDIGTLKTLADQIVFSNKISISLTDNEFELQGSSSDIISYLLKMADDDLIQKFTLSVIHLESGKYYLKVRANKT